MSYWNVNEQDKHGRTALFVAAELGDIEEVRRLLALGADPNIRSGPTDFGRPPLNVAFNVEIVRLLIDRGARVEDTTRVDHCALDHLNIVEFLCFIGVNVREQSGGWTPTLIAALSGYCDVVETLVAFDAVADIDTPNQEGCTPLMLARVYVDCVRLLLALNADTTKARNDGWTVSQAENKEMQQLLFEHSKKSENERQELRLETLSQIKHKVGIRLMRYAQPDIIGICLAMSSLELSPYVLLWIIDWLPNYHRVSHHKKIHLIESIRASIWRLKGIEK